MPSPPHPELIAGDAASRLLLIVDHASNHVPEDIDLGIDPALLDRHIAIDIGAGPLARALAERLDAPCVLAGVSRLVIDLHREPDHPALIPQESDGHAIPGNVAADAEARIARFYTGYHDLIATRIEADAPALLVTVHSFTPRLETLPDSERPWQIGLLYNQDDRAARIAIDLLRAEGLTVGDNEPYSGKRLNATLNRHGEARGLPYLAIEVRNDLIAGAAGVARWCDILAPVIAEVRNRLAPGGDLAT